MLYEMLNYEIETLRVWLDEQFSDNKFVVVYIDEHNEIEFLLFDTLDDAKKSLENLKSNNTECGIIKKLKDIKYFLNLFEFYPLSRD